MVVCGYVVVLVILNMVMCGYVVVVDYAFHSVWVCCYCCCGCNVWLYAVMLM